MRRMISINKKRKERTKVYKPYQQGNVFSSYAVKQGMRVFMLTLVSAVLFLFVGQILVITSGVLRVIINICTIGLFAMFMYAEGARLGEDDAAYGEIVYQRAQNGAAVSKDDLNRSFHPLKGYIIVLLGLAPLLIAAIIFAVITKLQVYQLGSLPSWLSSFERNRDIGLALAYYHEPVQTSLESVLRIIIRLLLFPYVSLFGADHAANMLMMERLSPLLLCIAPMFYGVGYQSGPHRRALVHGDIAAGIQKVNKREKKARKQRAQQGKRII